MKTVCALPTNHRQAIEAQGSEQNRCRILGESEFAEGADDLFGVVYLDDAVVVCPKWRLEAT